MRHRMRFEAMLAAALLLAGCATQPAMRLPDPSLVAMHEWDHGPPWGPEEIPWVAPPQVLTSAPGYWAPSIGTGLGFGFGRGHWWRGHRGFRGGAHHHGGFRGGHVRGRGRGRR